MKKKLKGVDILYMVLLGLCVIMVGIAIGKTRLYDMWNEELICNILHLQQEEQIAEDRHMMEKIQTKILYYILPQLPDDRMSLYGYVRNANVTIYKDYHIIYQSPKIEEEDGWYFSDTGDYMISVPLKQTDGGKKIQVLVTAGKDEIKNIQFYYGTGDGFMRMILKDEMTRMTILTITIILGAISIMLSKTLDPGIEAVSGNLYFGKFCILFSLVKVNDFRMTTIMYDNAMGFLYLSVLQGILCVTPFIGFMQCNTNMKKKHATMLTRAMNLLFVGILCLHMIGVLSLDACMYASYMVFAGLCLVFAICLCLHYKHLNLGQKLKSLLTILGVLLFPHLDLFALLVLDIMLFMITVWMGNHKLKQAEEGELYKQLAYIDEMTGLHNRSAYEEYLMENSKTDAASYVLMMDLNNLKQCNDILGHRVGDDYIMKAAASIRKVLEPHGCCYRIGGDEFVVLLLNISKDSFASMLEELQGEWDRIRQQEHRFVFQIAVGYAQASDKTTLQEMIEQADKMMYENKKELKQNAKLYDF